MCATSVYPHIYALSVYTYLSMVYLLHPSEISPYSCKNTPYFPGDKPSNVPSTTHVESSTCTKRTTPFPTPTSIKATAAPKFGLPVDEETTLTYSSLNIT